jgi:hypothetical protein
MPWLVWLGFWLTGVLVDGKLGTVTCIAHGVALLTRNASHFGLVGGLEIVAPDQLA